MDSINITRREVKGILKDIEGIENHCFHQILSTVKAPVFAQVPYICALLPFTFQELRQIPCNSNQLTKAFLVEYVDLIWVEGEKDNNISHRVYSCPGLLDFISNPVRAGVYHHFARSQFIQIVDEALEDGHFLQYASKRCVSLCAFHYNLNNFPFKDWPLNLNISLGSSFPMRLSRIQNQMKPGQTSRAYKI